MSHSTCRDCSLRSQLVEIESKVQRILVHLNGENDLDMAHRLLGETTELLGTVIDIKKEL